MTSSPTAAASAIPTTSEQLVYVFSLYLLTHAATQSVTPVASHTQIFVSTLQESKWRIKSLSREGKNEQLTLVLQEKPNWFALWTLFGENSLGKLL